MKTNELKIDYWKELQKHQKPIYHYDEKLDTLFLYFSEKEKDTIVSHFVDENVAFLFRRSDHQIIGMRIEYFREVFIPAIMEKREWKLSSTGEELVGIRDLRLGVSMTEVLAEVRPLPIPKPRARQYTIPKPIEKNVELDPVFA